MLQKCKHLDERAGVTIPKYTDESVRWISWFLYQDDWDTKGSHRKTKPRNRSMKRFFLCLKIRSPLKHADLTDQAAELKELERTVDTTMGCSCGQKSKGKLHDWSSESLWRPHQRRPLPKSKTIQIQPPAWWIRCLPWTPFYRFPTC